jgi:hypothetical protein
VAVVVYGAVRWFTRSVAAVILIRTLIAADVTVAAVDVAAGVCCWRLLLFC